MKNRVGSTWFEIQAKSSLLGAEKLQGEHELFISDQTNEVFQERERRRKLHRCIQTAIDSARRDWSSARRDWRLFFQTFQPSFVISWPISTNESEWILVGKLEIRAKRQRHFCSRVAKGTKDSAVFKKGTHTFGSISPNPYMQRPDQFVQGRDRGAIICLLVLRWKRGRELVHCLYKKLRTQLWSFKV